MYNAIGLAGVLTGTSDGHAVRALLEVITVDGELKLVALGRRVDGAGSWTFAADLPWNEILKKGQWVHLAATFDFAAGEMKLFMNGEPLAGKYTAANPWGEGSTSDTAPAGIKIGGSFPQNTKEANPFNGRMDDIMLLDTVPTAEQVAAQYALYAVPPVEPPTPPTCTPDGEVITDVMAEGDWARGPRPSGLPRRRGRAHRGPAPTRTTASADRSSTPSSPKDRSSDRSTSPARCVSTRRHP